jgi:hypothetical protein
MKIENFVRRYIVGIAAATGATFVAVSILSLLVDDPERYIDALITVPFALMFFGVMGVHLLQRDRGKRSELIGYRILAVTIATMVVTQPLIVFDVSALSWISFPGAFLGFLGGTVLFGYGMYRAQVLPSWCAIALGLSQFLTMAAGIALSPISPLSDYGDYSGAIVHCLVWLGIAYALLELQLSPRRSGARSVASPAEV